MKYKNINLGVLLLIFDYLFINQKYHEIELNYDLKDTPILNLISLSDNNESIKIKTNSGYYYLNRKDAEHFPYKIYQYLKEYDCL